MDPRRLFRLTTHALELQLAGHQPEVSEQAPAQRAAIRRRNAEGVRP